MRYLIICTVALAVSGLTLFSGFGLVMKRSRRRISRLISERRPSTSLI